ncbi:MAG: hypothetical protein V3S82_05250 [Dehalococcoidia bacterium]
MKARTIVTILAGCALAGGGYLLAHQRGKRIENEVHRQREAALAEVEGLQAATRKSEGNLRDALQDNRLLDEAVENLELALSDLGARDPEVREVIRWRTPEIEVAPDLICPTIIWPEVLGDDTPRPEPMAFTVEGAEARLITELGNVFAVGTVKLWRVKPLPEVMLGETAWRTDVTELMVTPESIPVTPRRWALGLGWTGGQFQGVTGMVSRDFFKSFRLQLGAGWMQTHGTGTGTADVIIDGEFLGTVVQDYELGSTGWVWSVAGFWRL